MCPRIDTERPEFKRRMNEILDILEKSLDEGDSYTIKYLLNLECGGLKNTLCAAVRSSQRYVDILNKEALLRQHGTSLYKESKHPMNALTPDGRIVKISFDEYRRLNEQRKRTET